MRTSHRVYTCVNVFIQPIRFFFFLSFPFFLAVISAVQLLYVSHLRIHYHFFCSFIFNKEPKRKKNDQTTQKNPKPKKKTESTNERKKICGIIWQHRQRKQPIDCINNMAWTVFIPQEKREQVLVGTAFQCIICRVHFYLSFLSQSCQRDRQREQANILCNLVQVHEYL